MGFAKWETVVRYLKGVVGVLLTVAAAILVITSVDSLLSKGFTSETLMVFLSDMLLVLILLELAKTVFAFLDNDERYLHSIMETAFIAVLREAIIIEVKGLTLFNALAIAVLILVIGYAYYRLYSQPRAV